MFGFLVRFVCNHSFKWSENLVCVEVNDTSRVLLGRYTKKTMLLRQVKTCKFEFINLSGLPTRLNQFEPEEYEVDYVDVFIKFRLCDNGNLIHLSKYSHPNCDNLSNGRSIGKWYWANKSKRCELFLKNV